jgi:hypothetical protein
LLVFMLKLPSACTSSSSQQQLTSNKHIFCGANADDAWVAQPISKVRGSQVLPAAAADLLNFADTAAQVPISSVLCNVFVH